MAEGKGMQSMLGIGGAVIVASAAWFGATTFVRSNLPMLNAPEHRTLSKPVRTVIESAYEAHTQQPTDVLTLERLARAYHANAMPRAALDVYAELIERDGEARWHYLIALIHDELGDSAAARSALEQYVEKRSNDPLAWYKLGESYFNARRFEDAQRAYATARIHLDVAPNNPPRPAIHDLEHYIRLGEARILFDQARYDAVVETLLPTIATTQLFGPAYRMLGRAAEAMNDELRATASYATADTLPPFTPPVDHRIDRLSEFSTSSTWLLREGNQARNKGDFAWAEILLRKTYELYPDDADVVSELGLLYVLLDEPNELIPLLPEILSGTPKHSATIVRLGSELARRGAAEPAIACLERARELSDSRANVHLNLGTAYAMASRFADAEASFRAALDRDPSMYRAKANLVRSLNDQKKFEQAIPVAIEATAQQPNDLESWRQLTIALVEGGSDEQKRMEIDRMLRQIRQFQLNQRQDEFLAMCELILAIEPNNPAVLALYGAMGLDRPKPTETDPANEIDETPKDSDG
ncbi:MAG: tetratricopeptide repeat protein [Planctomycetota bacterium]